MNRCTEMCRVAEGSKLQIKTMQTQKKVHGVKNKTTPKSHPVSSGNTKKSTCKPSQENTQKKEGFQH